MKKTAFILSGGGAAGAVQVGMLKRLFYEGIYPDKLFGTSAGALNCFGFSCGDVEGLEKMWRDIRKMSHVFDYNFGALIFGRTGLMNANPLRKRLETIHGRPAFDFEVCTADLINGSKKYFHGSEKEIVKYTVASASIPGIVSPVEDNGAFLVDGGTLENVPLKRAIDEGFTDIYVLLCQPFVRLLPEKDAPTNLLKVLFRSFEAMRHEMFLDDILTCLWCNELKNKGIAEYEKIEIKVMAPQYKVLDVMDFDREKIKEGISHGWSLNPVDLNYEEK